MEDSEWTEIIRHKVKRWRLFQSSGIHVLELGPLTLYMLAEKDYPVVNYWEIVHQMVNGAGLLNLQNDYDTDDQAFNLLSKYKMILDQQTSQELSVWKHPSGV